MTHPPSLANYSVLHFSPFVLAPIFEEFYEQLPPTPNSILLSYLVLPLTLNEASRSFLLNANKNSSLRTLTKISNRLYGLTDLLPRYKELTNQCVQLLVDSRSIRIDSTNIVCFESANVDRKGTTSDLLRAGKNLAKVLTAHDVVSAYRYLGIFGL